jgi:hypothetical protein
MKDSRVSFEGGWTGRPGRRRAATGGRQLRCRTRTCRTIMGLLLTKYCPLNSSTCADDAR